MWRLKRWSFGQEYVLTKIPTRCFSPPTCVSFSLFPSLPRKFQWYITFRTLPGQSSPLLLEFQRLTLWQIPSPTPHCHAAGDRGFFPGEYKWPPKERRIETDMWVSPNSKHGLWSIIKTHRVSCSLFRASLLNINRQPKILRYLRKVFGMKKQRHLLAPKKKKKKAKAKDKDSKKPEESKQTTKASSEW